MGMLKARFKYVVFTIIILISGLLIFQLSKISTWYFRSRVHLESIEPIDEDQFLDLKPLAEHIGDAPFVCIGEASHGVREFTTMRHRLIRFLILEMDFTDIALESPWSNFISANNYIHGNGESALQSLVGAGLKSNKATLDLLHWIREHNQSQSTLNAISIQAVDIDPTASTEVVLDYFMKVEPDYYGSVLRKYECVDYHPSVYKELSPEERVRCRSQIKDVEEYLLRNKEDYINRTSGHRFTQALDHSREIIMFEDAKNFSKQEGIRDQIMAKNVTSLLNQSDHQSKVILLAHNGHCRNISQYIEERYQKKSYFIGQTFFEGKIYAQVGGIADDNHFGSYTVLNIKPPPPTTFEWFANLASGKHHILFLDNLPASIPPSLSNTKTILIRSIPNAYDPSIPNFYFYPFSERYMDAIIFIEEGTPIQILSSLE